MIAILKKMMIPVVIIVALFVGGYFILHAFIRNDGLSALIIFVGGMAVLYGIVSWLNGDTR